MSFQFEPFKNNWLQYSDMFNTAFPIPFTVNLSTDFFKQLKFDHDSLRSYRIEAARGAAKQLGERPVLCLSGGVDSQAMIQCWQEAGLSFDIAILTFANGLNRQDSDFAKELCYSRRLSFIEIVLDVVQFLVRESAEKADLYRCISPHMLTHYKMFDMLRDKGYTGICCGGGAFAFGKDQWGPAPSPAQMNYNEYARVHSFPAMGNFLGYDPDLCWSIALLTPPHIAAWHGEEVLFANSVRYTTKVQGYINHGFDIKPQDQKYTGFELVKEYFAVKYKDGWTFEKKFRFPLEKKFGVTTTKLILTSFQLDTLGEIYSQRFTSGVEFPAGVTV